MNPCDKCENVSNDGSPCTTYADNLELDSWKCIGFRKVRNDYDDIIDRIKSKEEELSERECNVERQERRVENIMRVFRDYDRQLNSVNYKSVMSTLERYNNDLVNHHATILAAYQNYEARENIKKGKKKVKN